MFRSLFRILQQPARRPVSATTAGFTLVELLVVLLILALALSVVTPALWRATPIADLKGGARALAAGLQTARAEAIRDNAQRVVIIDTESRGFRAADSDALMKLPETLGLKATTAESELTDEGAGIRFYPDGSSTGGTVTLSEEDRSLTVKVDWLSGRVRIE